MTSDSNRSPTRVEPIPAEQVQQVLDAISHDLRAPSRQVKSFSQLLAIHLGEDIDDDTGEYLAIINVAADALHSKLDAVTRLAAIVAADLQVVPCSLAAMVNEAVAGLAENSSRVNAIDPDVTVMADPKWLPSVFRELLGNSQKFCGLPGTVSVTSHSEDGQWVVSVADEGPGFDATTPSRAFDLFKRFHDSSYPGSGAGLTIAQAILRRHGSELHLSSSRESGTTVSFSLPASS